MGLAFCFYCGIYIDKSASGRIVKRNATYMHNYMAIVSD